MEKRNRMVYLDTLRVAAACAVMVLHISAQNWYSVDVNGYDWAIFNFYDSIVRWAVPVFVMISGALFLNREIKICDLYRKYSARLVVAYFSWSTIYAIIGGGET